MIQPPSRPTFTTIREAIADVHRPVSEPGTDPRYVTQKQVQDIERQMNWDRDDKRELQDAHVADRRDVIEFAANGDETKVMIVKHGLPVAPTDFLKLHGKRKNKGDLWMSKDPDDRNLYLLSDAPQGTIWRIIPTRL